PRRGGTGRSQGRGAHDPVTTLRRAGARHSGSAEAVRRGFGCRFGSFGFKQCVGFVTVYNSSVTAGLQNRNAVVLWRRSEERRAGEGGRARRAETQGQTEGDRR